MFKNDSARVLLFSTLFVLSSMTSACIGMYDNDADLVVDKNAAVTSLKLEDRTFASNSCAIEEACVGGPGMRRLLRFDGVIQNQGPGDLMLGKPEGNPLFEYAACHGHHHMKTAMRYELIDPTTKEIVTVDDVQVVGRKQGFCMLDMRQDSGSHFKKFTCENQGLTSGWADIYKSSLDCQWVDVTGVPAGDYLLRITVNPEGLLYEINTTNNSVEVPVVLPDPASAL